MNHPKPQEQGEEALTLGRHEANSSSRSYALRWLQHIPTVVDGLRKLAPSDVFRVIVSAENAKFFKQAEDGFYKPFLRDGGKFVENVDLKRLPPDHLGAISDLLLSVNMAAIAADLNAIKIGVRDLGTLIADSARGEAFGAISALRQAKVLTNPVEQRHEALGACRDLSIQLGKLTGQLKAHCSAMPEPTTGILDGFFGSGLDEADAKWREVEQDLLVLRDGLSLLLETYSALGEPGAANEALRSILRGIREADLPNAVRKARLVRMSAASTAPEVTIKEFTHIADMMNMRLLGHEAPLLLPVVIDLTREDLELCQTPQDAAPAGAN